MMNWKNITLLVTLISILGLYAGCQSIQNIAEENNAVPEIKPTVAEPTVTEPTVTEPTVTEPTVTEPVPISESGFAPLPDRSGPRTQTTGSVPHIQIDVDAVQAVNDELYRRTFALPDVEKRPTIVSLPGADGMWLSDGVPLANPEGIVNGREFAHIHPDGSLHAPLPYERALEAVEKGWAERHPWAEQRDGWEGFVMLFTPQTMEELDVTFQLIVESYNHVTGRTVQASDYTN